VAGVNAIRQLFRDMRTQKLRTLLTASGIVWGTVAVSLLLAFGQGLHRHLHKSQAGLGENIIIGWPALTSIPYEGLGKGRRIRLAEEDVQLVRQRVQGLAGISGEWSRGSLRMKVGDRTLPVDISGVSPIFGELRSLVPQPGGRFINRLDEERQRRVIFLGNTLARDIFPGEDPVGQTLELAGSPFAVIGVLQEKEQDSSYSGRDKDKAFVPASTFRTLTGVKYVNNIIFKAERALDTERVKQDVLETLAAKHRFDPHDKEALGTWDTTEGFQFLAAFMLGLKLFMGIIGSLTLVVGGIGVSNIMNVVVEERTHEIGVKMALGARSRSVLNQFLVETFILTVIGGSVGLLLTYGLCQAFPATGLQEFVGVPELSWRVALITAGLLGGIGLLAGYFPARDAANLDPVVAMKL
jgi:putative ABC transport system permease protein